MDTSSTLGTTASPSGSPSGVRGFVARHPIATFLTISFAVAYPLTAASLLAGVDLMPAKLAGLLAMVGGAILATAWSSSEPGRIRALFAGLTRWRFGAVRWVLVLAAVPLLTLLIAALTGTLDPPDGGWGGIALTYLLFLVLGVATGNLWEETAWAGFLQNRLMSARGLLIGSLLTAIPFFLMHLPLAYETNGLHGTTIKDAVIDWVAIAALTPVLRVLIGMLLRDTGGSTLAASLLHGSFNAAGAMAVLAGGWQQIPALAVLAAAYAVMYARRVTTPAPALVTVA